MKMTCASVAISACVALGLAFGPAARAESERSPNDGQARIADATLKLEKAFNDQFVHGAIDRGALSGPIDEVLRAMPEAARPKVEDHIAQVLQSAEKLASEMTPAARAQATAPDTIG